MFKYYFEKIENVEIFPVLALLIFFTFFVLLLIWVIRIDRTYVNKMKNLPMEHEDTSNSFSIEQKPKS